MSRPDSAKAADAVSEQTPEQIPALAPVLSMGGDPALVRATSDSDIVRLYLQQRNDQGAARFSPRTYESYRRDIKRLAVFLDGRPFASITLEDVEEFIQWLRNPPAQLISQPPTEDGQAVLFTRGKRKGLPVGAKRLPIDHPDWQPFYLKGLSQSAIRQQLASLKAFYGWLNDAGLIQRNPFRLMKSSPPVSVNIVVA